jgi:hypothetical protein
MIIIFLQRLEKKIYVRLTLQQIITIPSKVRPEIGQNLKNISILFRNIQQRDLMRVANLRSVVIST